MQEDATRAVTQTPTKVVACVDAKKSDHRRTRVIGATIIAADCRRKRRSRTPSERSESAHRTSRSRSEVRRRCRARRWRWSSATRPQAPRRSALGLLARHLCTCSRDNRNRPNLRSEPTASMRPTRCQSHGVDNKHTYGPLVSLPSSPMKSGPPQQGTEWGTKQARQQRQV